MPAMPSTSWIQTYGSANRPVMKSHEKNAESSATAPNRPAACPFCLTVMMSSAPAMRLDRTVRGEQPERANREEVDEVLQFDRSLAERVEVRHRAQVGNELARRALSLRGRPADDPRHQQHDERDQRRDHLALRQAGDE